MPDLHGALIQHPEIEWADEVARLEDKLREFRLPAPRTGRSGRRIVPGLGIAAATLVVAGAFAATGHFPPLH
ncbi:hypothetical protein [Enterovirga aerilata]|uniref:Uncharacterized protein n=1 Tax=Enterovirga aerilata TaxID=2730920 RepID=A0A849I7B1_9HYPH|nr:hypothetical protein [Enterovirga sp. DB1703]NNM71917.1 hypothetical protein [Enterovirga sp. DB1703]